jgi:FKBP-type peptidyl-prolyl cis-trans isomerase SlyD
MEKIEPGKYVEIAYDLFEVTEGGSRELLHQVTAEAPEKIVYGVTPGVIVPLVQAIENLAKGDKFDVVVKPEDAFGVYTDELLRAEELPRQIFERDGKVDEKEIHVGAHIFLQTNMGQEVPATIMEISGDIVKVVVDFNHPLAGKTIAIAGSIVEVRQATAEEIAANQSHGCSCGCHDHDCGDGCGCGDDHHCGDDTCHCGH